MTEQTATILVLGVTAAGLLVWIVSVLRALRVLADAPEGEMRVAGETETEGPRREISRRIAESLTAGPAMGMVPWRVDAAGEDRVGFRAPEGLILPLLGGLEGEYLLARGESGVRVTLRTNRAAERKGARIALWICFLAGLPVLVGVAVLLMTLVVGHEHPAMRGQAFQILQIVHPLWPPFLIMWLGGRSQKLIEASLGQVLDRLRFVG